MEGQSEQQLDATPVIAMCARFTVLKSATPPWPPQSRAAPFEARVYDGADGRRRVSLATLSELSICEQVTAKGTLLDRQLLAKDTLRERYFRSQQRASRAFF